MAIYHYSVQVISRSKGRNTVAAAAYRSGTKLQNERLGLTYDYSRKGGVEYATILAPPNAPEWVYDRESLWNQVEQVEKRKDAQLSREVNLALPKELSFEKNLELLTGFVQDQFVQKGMVADVAVHWSDDNPHAHIMLTMRSLDGDQFGQKNRGWNDKAVLAEQRQQWAHHANRALETSGIDSRIDHRSLIDQGITYRMPQIHLGVHVAAMEEQGISTERGGRQRRIKHANAIVRKELEELEQIKRAILREQSSQKKMGLSL